MSFELKQAGQENQQGLPRELGNGVTLRWSTQEDTEPLIQFLGSVFSHDDDQPDEGFLRDVRQWMAGQNPMIGPNDFTIVTDDHQAGKFVSALTLVSQTWAYEGIPFKVGQIESVATEPAYRRQGLVRQQMAVIHARSASRGQMMQVIGGIPWYYRQFGYDMALAMQGSRRLYWPNQTRLEKDEAEVYQLRPATLADLDLLKQLYAIHCQASLVTQVRSDREWHYNFATCDPKAETYRRFYMIEEIGSEDVVGYIEVSYDFSAIKVRELAVLPGQSMRLIGEFLTRSLKTLSDERAGTANRREPFSYVVFSLGTEHPGYTALGKQLSELNEPYAWYVRIPHLAEFLLHIAPALNQRLARSVFEGYSGTLRLNFYRSFLTLVIERGKLIDVSTYTPTDLHDGDAAFPNLIFLQLLLGYHSLSELEQAYPDCLVRKPRNAILLETLFPKRSSSVAASG